MSYKDIAVYQGFDEHSDDRLSVGIALAKKFGANLTGVYVITQPVIPSFIQADIPTKFGEERYREIRALAHARKEMFEGRIKENGVKGTFFVIEGNATEATAEVGRYTDLVIVGQPDPDHPMHDDGVAEGLLMSSGRPVLIVPYVGCLQSFGKRVMVAWNATREGSRAVHDALPILQQAEEVTVIEVNPTAGAFSSTALCDHLKRHGVHAVTTHTVAHDADIGDVLLSAIAANSIDLLVMGGYGHSRIRELVLGGATRQVLHSMTCPVMMSH